MVVDGQYYLCLQRWLRESFDAADTVDDIAIQDFIS